MPIIRPAGALLPIAAMAAPVAAQTQPPPPPFAASHAVPDAALAAARGTADLSVIDQMTAVQSNSTVTGNSITGNFTTGTIAMASDTFEGFSGLALFNVNTGNNVAINASMNVNVAFQQ